MRKSLRKKTEAALGLQKNSTASVYGKAYQTSCQYYPDRAYFQEFAAYKCSGQKEPAAPVEEVVQPEPQAEQPESEQTPEVPEESKGE